MGVTGVTRGAFAAVVALLSDVVALGAPPACAGCARTGESVCVACRACVVGPPRPHSPSPVPDGWIPLHVCATYDGITRSLITQWKEHGRRDVAAFLSEALATSVRGALAVAQGNGSAVMVPVPASAAARRRRGEDAWLRVVHGAARLLRGDGVDVGVASCLTLARQPLDQSGLSAAARRDNVEGAFVCALRPRGAVVIVDDIVTTGATVTEAARALRAAGITAPVGAAIAATRRHGCP